MWQPVELIIYENIKLQDESFHLMSLTKDSAYYEAVLDVFAQNEGIIKAEVLVDEWVFEQNQKIEAGYNQVTIPFTIHNPKLWWCTGLGEPNLYLVKTQISTNGRIVDQSNTKIGVRTVEFVQEADSIGESFYFKLNGRPVFMKGANYIPSDHLVTRQDSVVYRRTLMDAKDANMNTLRVWGGAIYEKDLFYELSDELGIMIWQDFMFACSMFPNDSLHIESIRKEAEYNVNRLKNHPSVVFWCGNNENNVGWNNWGWQDGYDEATCDHIWKGYEKVFYEVLPNAVKKHDPELS